MAKSPSPFTGMKLTDQTPLAKPGVDQQLFGKPASPPAQPVQPEVQEPVVPPKPPKAAPVSIEKREPVEMNTAETQGFDLNHLTQKSETFAFTFEELLALSELKTGLSRLLGLDARITKIDIMRSALQIIVEDYRKRGEQSSIVARMKTKRPVDRIRKKKPR
jgi:hypothetical protein